MSQQTRWARYAASNLGLAITLAGCSSLAPSEPVLPAGAVAVSAPEVYRDWQLRTEGCSGLVGDYPSLQFYVVPGVDTFPTEAGPKVGLWRRESGINRIVIAGNYAANEMVVRHEMLHALLQREGHPAEYFVERCHLTWDSWNSNTGE